MASINTIADPALHNSPPPATHAVAEVLVCLPSLSADAIPTALATIAAAFPGESVLVATADHPDTAAAWPSLELIPYARTLTDVGWVLAAADYAAAAHIAADRKARAIILFGDNTAVVNAPLLRALADSVRTDNADLALPRFNLGPNDALVNSALLYPLSRALFGADIHFPLPIDAAISTRMAQRLLPITQRLVNLGQGASLLWPVTEAALSGLSVRELPAGDTPPPSPPPSQTDFNTLFASVAGSLFSDIDAKATFWQRARSLPFRPSSTVPPPSLDPEPASADIHDMIESFHLAQNNLQEIWSLVLPPQSRLALKKLSQLSSDDFTLEPNLWARIVYDFALAFHLRTLNRNHLLGAMTPLYLGWVASYLRNVADDSARAARAIEDTAAAFEDEKSYIVSRWRWPDRFNP
jgi:hypothetical protein